MVSVQYRPTGSTARAIAESIETGIRLGAYPPDGPLPSVRGLAHDLGVAAGTVAAAYRTLRGRGLVEGRGRLGTCVRPRPPLPARAVDVPLTGDIVDLSGGQPDPRLLPVVPVRPRRPGAAAAPPALVLPDLARLGAARLAADGLPPGPIAVTSGGLDGVARVLSAHLRPGDAVAVEDPGWPSLLALAAGLGLRVLPLVIDVHGPRPESLQAALRGGIRAVVVTSRAQNPTGAFLTSARADQLRAELADHPDVLTVEDDHAAELAGVPLATLAAATRSWAFVRSSSKPYGPDLRVALVTGDDATVARVEERIRAGSGWVSTLLQQLVVDLWDEPGTDAVIKAAAAAYDARRHALIDALAARDIAAVGATGLNVWIPVTDEASAATSLYRQGWAVAPGARFRRNSAPGIRITVSAVDLAQVERLAGAVETALRAPSGGVTSA